MNVKRKILIVNSSISGGGAGKALIYLIRALKKDQVEQVVILPADGVIGEEIRKQGVTIHYLPWLPERFGKTQFVLPKFLQRKRIQRMLNVLLMPIFSFQVSRLARKLDVDAICSNHQFHIPVCVGAGCLSGKSVIIYSRDYVEGFWAQLCFRTLAKANIVRRVFAVSRKAGELYADLPKLEVLYDCYDFDTFGGALIKPTLRSTFNISSDTFVFGFVGRIVERKGVDFLIRAFAKVHSRFTNTHLAVVGGNDPGLSFDLLSSYRDLARELGVETNVTFTGFEKDVRIMTYDFDTFVMPSLNPEPFGLVYLEAVICRVPCIVPDNSGAAEAVVHGKDGYIFKAMDGESLQNVMCDVIGQRSQFQVMTANAFAHAKKMFDVDERSEEVTKAFANF